MGVQENREKDEGGKVVKGFIEVHDSITPERPTLINVSEIAIVHDWGIWLNHEITNVPDGYIPVEESYEEIKALIDEATAPSFTVLKESDDDCS